MTDNVKSWLNDIYDDGERSNRKADVGRVAKDMLTVKDDNGQRLFSKDERLKERQIASYFSRRRQNKLKSAMGATLNDQDEVVNPAELDAPEVIIQKFH